MREFAETAIIVPDGPFEGRRYRCSRQPSAGLWFDAVDSGRWNRFAATGPSQSGKTLSCMVIPALYHLFAVQETVILGIPDLDMASDKWRIDFLPAIERTKFREFLPRVGVGSRGGQTDTVHFRHGRTLKFMSGGGGDKRRAGFTSRVLIVTEVDGMDEAGMTSREADKISQMEARVRAYGSRRRIYFECTTSIEEGRIWQEYQKGTASRIAVRCPKCGAHVTPEREHLRGWETAETIMDAREGAAFHCPDCAAPWSEEERSEANASAILLHRGQEIGDDGEIEGDVPRTDTFGFRWSAVNNLFVSAGDVAADEWKATQSTDEDNAEKMLRQFIWALPHVPDQVDLAHITPQSVASRVAKSPRAVVPSDAIYLTVAFDPGKFVSHWTACAWNREGGSTVVDYGVVDVPTDSFGVEKATFSSLEQFRDLLETGFPQGDIEGPRVVPHYVFIDSGYQTDVVYEFLRQQRARGAKNWYPTKGFGQKQRFQSAYSKPKAVSKQVRYIGDGYHVGALPKDRLLLVSINADEWKSFVHSRMTVPQAEPTAMLLYSPSDMKEHLTFGRHICAEKKVEEFVPGRGTMERWEKRNRTPNHYFDTTYMAAAAAHLCGVRLVGSKEKPRAPPEAIRARPLVDIKSPDGRPYFVTQRE